MRSALRLSALPCLALLAVGCADLDDSEYDDGDIYGSGTADSVRSELPDRLVDVPFYFSMPKQAVTTPLDRPDYPQPTVWNPSDSGEDVGLRLIAVEQGSTLSSRKAARRSMSATLGPARVLQTGDIVLSFRPELAGTMAYPHIQMGTTHAGLVVLDEDGVAFNLDSPLDSEYLGQFDAKHYAGEIGSNGEVKGGTHALHVLRPRNIDESRRARLQQWSLELRNNLPRINGERRQVKFQSDYLMPAYAAHGATPRQMVTTLGKIILEEDTDTQLPMYCSEFAWHMLALSGCTEAEILEAPEEGAACVDPPFAPMPLIAQTDEEVGISQGPLNALMTLPVEERSERVPAIFAEGNAEGLSSGHRAVAESVRPLMGPLADYYQARAAGATVEDLAESAAAVNASFADNYSPTAYFIQAMGDEANRAVDYVATVVFVDAEGYAKARELARLPVP